MRVISHRGKLTALLQTLYDDDDDDDNDDDDDVQLNVRSVLCLLT